MSVHMMNRSVETKAVVSVAEMARMVGLSRSRFYQLQKAGVFPQPCYSVSNRRPIYVEEQQEVCLEVRRRNTGISGQPVLFYARRLDHVGSVSSRRLPASRSSPRPRVEPHADLVEPLRSLGLTSVTALEVQSAIRACFPSGINGAAEGEVIRSLFRHLRQANRAELGR